jgi:hypothetical protein
MWEVHGREAQNERYRVQEGWRSVVKVEYMVEGAS